ncbi:cyclase family protein [Roseospira marina]|uniref:Cyclase family protein n=1 Tax=Roseospira marina TaxID=140057 RepID=A0A5M6IF02_9PROT|nr:cyclase family protein [Roseospira marina]KAA5606866.1 cyclase family protein [Roseospira marina]MBB4312966.1 kynurenine formamidase [Roseospira marina]MBB5086261.1 kynurenine formamidase [Roseospira marina]
MTDIIDLTQTFEDGMPGFRMKGPDGVPRAFTASVQPFLTHEASAPNYADGVSFEITEVQFQTSIGTYLDSPRHRYPGRADIADLPLASLILDGVVVDGRAATPERPLGVAELPPAESLRGKAVLIRFGWDRHWGTDAYFRYPIVDRAGLAHLRDADIGLFGVDTINADDSADLERPAHTWFLDSGIHIVENLRGLEALGDRPFRFFAIPLKVRAAAAFPVRAFAEVR